MRPRTVVYAAVIAIAGTMMLYTLLTRVSLHVSVLHDRNPLFVSLTDGSIRNAHTVHVLNHRNEARTVRLDIAGISSPQVQVVGLEGGTARIPLISVEPDQARELRVLVTVAPGAKLDRSTPLTFRITDIADGETATATDHFVTR